MYIQRSKLKDRLGFINVSVLVERFLVVSHVDRYCSLFRLEQNLQCNRKTDEVFKVFWHGMHPFGHDRQPRFLFSLFELVDCTEV